MHIYVLCIYIYVYVNMYIYTHQCIPIHALHAFEVISSKYWAVLQK